MSVTFQEKQEEYPRRQICVSLSDRLFINSSRLTNNEYKKEGKWSTDMYSEEELSDRVAPKFSEIVGAITISKLLSPISGEYDKIRVLTENVGL